MFSVVFAFSYNGPNGPIPSKGHLYRSCYEYFHELARRRGILVYRGRTQDYDAASGIFRKLAAYTPQRGWYLVYNIRPDLISDKISIRPENTAVREALAQNHRILCDPSFTYLADDKLAVSRLFPKHFKQYFLIHSKKALREGCKKITGNYVVVKPRIGSGGKGIVIEEKNRVLRKNFNFPVIIQEFIDSSRGIRRLTPSYHDLRLVFVHHKLIYSYIRTPKKGSLLANISQGGKMRLINPKRLPKSIFPIIQEVKKKFRKFPHAIYTIDLMFDREQRPWIIEFNTMPGMYFSTGQRRARRLFYNAILDEFSAFMKK